MTETEHKKLILKRKIQTKDNLLLMVKHISVDIEKLEWELIRELTSPSSAATAPDVGQSAIKLDGKKLKEQGLGFDESEHRI